ncbi:MAG: NAD(P)-dependent oxidoreductase [Deltaproteobacteria bacterium]|nr:NAD(P)-dependent oxidoreductase [Deltaproteobacteria bacterium]
MRVLVTGATGFIGSRLVLRCLAEDMAVRALGRRNNPAEAENASGLEAAGAEFSEIPVADRDGLVAAMAGVDVVFHLAAAQHEANVADDYFRSINVDGTRNVLEAAEQAGVGRVVHGSTIGVFGWRSGEVVNEGSPLEPENIYGITKLEGEQVVRASAERVPVVIARISETYGPGDRRLLKLFRAAERGLALQIGSGQNLHHLVYIDDLLDGLLLLGQEERAVGTTCVLAGREPVSSRAMLEAVSRSLGRPPRILRLPLSAFMLVALILETLLRPLGIQPPLHRRRLDFFRKSFAFSRDEASVLGHKPRVGLDDGMRATARWYRERGLISQEGG